jgi:hypothetical protein
MRIVDRMVIGCILLSVLYLVDSASLSCHGTSSRLLSTHATQLHRDTHAGAHTSTTTMNIDFRWKSITVRVYSH